MKYDQSSDLTVAPIPALVRKLAIPVSVGFFFSTMYNVTDTWFGGRISTDALAALSLSFPVFFILIAFGAGSSIGATALTGSALGRGDREAARRNAAQAVSYGAVITVPVALLGVWSTPHLYRLMGASGDYLALSLEYMDTIFSGTLFFLGVHMFNSTLTAMGNTKPFRNFLAAGFFINIFLDWWFIHGGLGLPAMGLKGIALATVLVQGFGMVYMGREAVRMGAFQGVRPRDFIPRLRAFRDIAHQALPACFNYLTIGIGIFVITHFISRFGQEGVAAYGAAVRVEHLGLLPALGLNTAVLALTAQNHGAGHMDRVRETVSVALKYGFVVTLAGTVLCLTLPETLMGLFSEDPKVVLPGAYYLRVDALVFFGYVVLFVNQAALQGMKKPMFAMWMGLARQIVFPFLLLNLVAVRLGFGLPGIWWTVMCIVWAAAGVAHFYSHRVLKREEAWCRAEPVECGTDHS